MALHSAPEPLASRPAEAAAVVLVVAAALLAWIPSVSRAVWGFCRNPVFRPSYGFHWKGVSATEILDRLEAERRTIRRMLYPA